MKNFPMLNLEILTAVIVKNAILENDAVYLVQVYGRYWYSSTRA
jgi:hypothetical protein